MARKTKALLSFVAVASVACWVFAVCFAAAPEFPPLRRAPQVSSLPFMFAFEELPRTESLRNARLQSQSPIVAELLPGDGNLTEPISWSEPLPFDHPWSSESWMSSMSQSFAIRPGGLRTFLKALGSCASTNGGRIYVLDGSGGDMIVGVRALWWESGNEAGREALRLVEGGRYSGSDGEGVVLIVSS